MESKESSKKSTWGDVTKELGKFILLLGVLRWLCIEPFLVPSGSMIPSLLVKDYIVATKFDFGLRIPFTKTWLYGPILPQRGNVVVFKSKDKNFYFMVKRVVGLPGDRIQYDRDLKKMIINGVDIPLKKMSDNPAGTSDENDFQVYSEDFSAVVRKGSSKPVEAIAEDLSREFDNHLVQYHAFEGLPGDVDLVVPKDMLFLMGDNRDRSADSRTWGFLPTENLMGRARRIWMSCKDSGSQSEILCFGSELRAERVFKKIQ